MKLKYLVCYDTPQNKAQLRTYAPSAATVVDSVLDTLKDANCEVELISFASTSGNQMVPSTNLLTKQGFPLHLFRSFGRKNLLSRVLNAVFMRLQYYCYLLFQIKRGDTVIAYHSPYHTAFLYFLKKIKRFRLILQMLEIYADVYDDPKLRKKELALANVADAFIFPTTTMDHMINTQNKPSVIMLGTYSVEPNRNVRFEDGKIHVLYAGTLDPRKGGATAAVAAAEFLPSNYHIHILGFGSDQEKEDLLKVIAETQDSNHAAVTYDGLLSGEDYIRFVQSCDIGLSTQNPDAAFNTTSFPSKILSYLSNGLHVVSIDIDPVKNSSIGDLITYYDIQNPESIAAAIHSVDLSAKSEGTIRLAKLAHQLEIDLTNLLFRT